MSALYPPMPCRWLAVKDAEGAAARSKILKGDGTAISSGRAARSRHSP